jgi:predicted GNAT family acetyltransferase
MELITYSDAAGFLARSQDWLERHETANNLMLGLALRLRQFPERIRVTPYYATVEDERGLILAAVMTPPYRVILFGERPDAAAAFEPILNDLEAHQWPLPGVLGPRDIALAAAKRWSTRTGRPHHIGRRERIYELRRVNPLPPAPGRLRLATMDELALAAEWTYAFQQDAGDLADRDAAQEMAAQRITDRQLYLWDDGGPVSMCGSSRPTAHGITVSLVYTPPALRRRGYARAAVAALSQNMLDAGWQFCTLFTDLANPTSNHIYQEIGYAPVCDYHEYTFEP